LGGGDWEDRVQGQLGQKVLKTHFSQ
jgi:hypothetical protein